MRNGIAAAVAMWICGITTHLHGANAGLINIKGTIGPATASYVSRAIEVASQREDECLIIQLDTPGGLLDSTQEIVEKFHASRVPIVVYVAPAGAWAGSAGCFITMAADVAAMSFSTSIGAAHPVGVGTSEKLDDVMKQKVEKFSSKYIRSIAEEHGRNADWAESAVVQSESLTASNALEMKVIDIIADDLPSLLRQLDGRKIRGRALHTIGAKTMPIPMTGTERFLQLLSHPEIMVILMLVAIYGIIGELSSPGAILPGVVGGIALILALYMAAVLPVNVAGLALVGLAVVLFIADVYAPTHGVLTFGGIISFFLGMLMLFNRADPGFKLPLSYIIPATVITALFFIFIVGAGLRAQMLPVRVGRETMVGKTVEAMAPINTSQGKVLFEGEYWNAISDAPVAPGQKVVISEIDGLTLKVRLQPT